MEIEVSEKVKVNSEKSGMMSEKVKVNSEKSGMSWKMVKLGDIMTISKGKKHTPIENGKNRYINIENLHNASNSLFTNESGVFVAENDLIIAWDGANAGKVGVGFSGVIGSTLARMSVKGKESNSRFLYWFLESKNELIKSQRTGATIPHVNGVALKELQIPLPPLPIQKRIAEILDAADALKRKDQELLKKYDELAQAIFIDMFGDPVKNEKGWEVKTIGESIDFMTSGSRGWAQYYSENGDLFLRINNVGYNEMKLQDLIYVVAPNNAEATRTEVKPRDILLSITADLGRTCVIPENFPKAFINQHLAILRLKKEFEPAFVSQVLSSEFGKMQFKRLNKGGVKAGLNFDDIKSLEFINPPIKYQIKYKQMLDEVIKQSDVIITINKRSTSLFQTLIQKAFKGELVE